MAPAAEGVTNGLVMSPADPGRPTTRLAAS